jgi:hypothetical protein
LICDMRSSSERLDCGLAPAPTSRDIVFANCVMTRLTKNSPL